MIFRKILFTTFFIVGIFLGTPNTVLAQLCSGQCEGDTANSSYVNGYACRVANSTSCAVCAFGSFNPVNCNHVTLGQINCAGSCEGDSRAFFPQGHMCKGTNSTQWYECRGGGNFVPINAPSITAGSLSLGTTGCAIYPGSTFCGGTNSQQRCTQILERRAYREIHFQGSSLTLNPLSAAQMSTVTSFCHAQGYPFATFYTGKWMCMSNPTTNDPIYPAFCRRDPTFTCTPGVDPTCTINPLPGGGSGSNGGVTSATFDILNNAIFGNSGPAADLTTPRGIISRLIPYLFTFAGLILFIMILWGGFEMLSGAASAKNQEAGKQRITAAIIGFFLLFCSYWLAQLVELVLGVSIL